MSSFNFLDRLKPSELPTAAPDTVEDEMPTTIEGAGQAMIFQPPGHPKQALIDGEIWPPIFKAEFVRSAKQLSLQSSDVVVVTYPKCGTTWIQHICAQLMSADYGPEEGKELYLTSPMIERMGANYVDTLKHPRLLKTHFNYKNCPQSEKAKYIFAVRNPKDCLTSYYFHNQLFNIYEFENGDFTTFCDLFLAGKLGFGDYFEHLKSWLPHIHDDNVLFLKYEDMCEDLETAVRKIGHFLGGSAAVMVDNRNILKQVVAESRIDSMKKNQNRFFSESALRKKDGFIRKGGSRNWKKHMTREQSDRMDTLFHKQLAGTEAQNWWSYEMCWDDDAAIRIALAEDDEGCAVSAASSAASSMGASRRNSVDVTPSCGGTAVAASNARALAGLESMLRFRRRAATCYFERSTTQITLSSGQKNAANISQVETVCPDETKPLSRYVRERAAELTGSTNASNLSLDVISA